MIFLYRYSEKHQVQLFGRGHIAGIDVKVRTVNSCFTVVISSL